MKANQLKSIIKEAVREAVREEIKEILTEAVNTASQPKNNLQQTPKSIHSSNFKSSGDPMMEMLNMTQRSMTQEDFKSFNNVSEQVTGLNQIMNDFNSSLSNNQPASISSNPQHGIDISKLDFVGKAAAVYNKALQKDQFRVGG